MVENPQLYSYKRSLGDFFFNLLLSTVSLQCSPRHFLTSSSALASFRLSIDRCISLEVRSCEMLCSDTLSGRDKWSLHIPLASSTQILTDICTCIQQLLLDYQMKRVLHIVRGYFVWCHFIMCYPTSTPNTLLSHTLRPYSLQLLQ